MKKHTCHLDLHQRSLYVTIWTKELGSKVDRQPQEEVARQPREEIARQPRGEVSRHAKFSQPTQPIPKPISDRSGQLDYKHEASVDKAKHPGLKRSRRNLLTKNSVLQIDQGNLISRPAQLELRQICLKKSELSKLTIDQGNLTNMKSHYEQPLNCIVRL